IGSRTDSTTTHHWHVPPIHGGPAAIQIDVEPFEIGNNYRLTVPVAGDAKLVLIDLLAAIDRPAGIGARNRPRIDGVVAERDRYWADVERQAAVTSQPIKPQLLVRAMRELFDDSVQIVADPGTPTPYLGAQYELRQAGRTTIIPRAHGGLGYAIPGVVGAYYGRGNRRGGGRTGEGGVGLAVGESER